ncbi:uncharacterized protein LOC116180669 [Photinus pyralis]|uniref:uncharacterized protein LOC116180669 n=1 Tax=Photinus pyralis TaxID=7054 RepID=UPI0012672783|nr:uncharacterized protein LOC116180669 [Photinus pyralis]
MEQLDMEQLKKLRTSSRQAFTKAYNALEVLLAGDSTKVVEVKISWQLLQERYETLVKTTEGLHCRMSADEEISQENLTVDMDEAEKYTRKFLTGKYAVEETLQLLEPSPSSASVQSTPGGTTTGVINIPVTAKKMKLPVINLIKFGGSTREWLRFWGQFQKIDLDAQMSTEDKFEYLIAAMVPGSRAAELIARFPPTGDNYAKAVDSLKNRFGREDLLVEVYIRELLTLVLQNAKRGINRDALGSLYDKLESHMQALATLGVTTDKCAAMLYPLVESALPEELLRTWQRTTESRQAKDCKEKLEALMQFIGTEVEAEEKIRLATDGFGLLNKSERSSEKMKASEADKSKKEQKIVPTAMGLLTTKSKDEICIFCNGDHSSADCDKARSMNLDERQKVARDKNCCFNCLKQGHSFRRCRVQLKCQWCSKRHVMVMCRSLANNKSTDQPPKAEKEKATTIEQNLAYFLNVPEVCLMTLTVTLLQGKREQIVRAVIDTGSQNSYIREADAVTMGYHSEREEEITHTLFGGVKTRPQKHHVYRLHLRSVDGSYACTFEAKSQENICDKIPAVKFMSNMQVLEKQGIFLSDVGSSVEQISILIGADIAGKLLTGQRVQLDNGLVALETLLGWTLMGKLPVTTSKRNDITLIVISLLIQDRDIANFWDLETIGIKDLASQKSKETREKEVVERFLETVTVNEEGRYEIELPWTEEHLPLSSNRRHAERRLFSLTKKLQLENRLLDYHNVLQEWSKEGIIELVPKECLNQEGHYLAHRHKPDRI